MKFAMALVWTFSSPISCYSPSVDWFYNEKRFIANMLIMEPSDSGGHARNIMIKRRLNEQLFECDIPDYLQQGYEDD